MEKRKLGLLRVDDTCKDLAYYLIHGQSSVMLGIMIIINGLRALSDILVIYACMCFPK